ncbi:hypothetical protein EJK15_51960 [Nonomuraea basaltis]|nr:hypothetical protein EJK15_51960 [Nonomuraea basaltis]
MTGLGPWENHPDRRASALLARWSSPVHELATPYVKPQENGIRGGVDELTLTGPRRARRGDLRRAAVGDGHPERDRRPRTGCALVAAAGIRPDPRHSRHRPSRRRRLREGRSCSRTLRYMWRRSRHPVEGST